MNGKSAKTVRDVRLFLEGTICDRAMRALLESDDPQPGQLVDSLPELFVRFTTTEADGVIKWRGHPLEDKKKALRFCQELLTKLEPWLFSEVIPHGYQPELRFSTQVGIPHPVDGKRVGVYLIGAIDIAVKESEERYVLYDLKATKDHNYLAATLGQSVFYDLAFGSWIGDKTQPKAFGFVTPMTRQFLQWATITEDDRRVMISRIMKMAQSLIMQEYQEPTPNGSCQWCEVVHLCDAFAIKSTKDDAGRNRISFDRKNVPLTSENVR